MIINVQNAFVAPFSGKYKSGLNKGNKKRTLKEKRCTGVYFIKEDGAIVYIGMSQSDLISALYRHFYRYSDSHRRGRTYYNAGYGGYEVAIIKTSKQDAATLERGLILSVNPRDNKDKFRAYLDQLSVQNIRNEIQQSESEYVPEIIEDLPF